MKKALLAILASISLTALAATPRQQYRQMLRGLAKGWNTWDTRSVFTQVYLPHQFAIKITLIDAEGNRAEELRIGNMDPDAAVLRPGDHSYDGSYTDISASWHGIRMRLRTVADGPDLTILANAEEGDSGDGYICIEPRHCWEWTNRWDRIETHENGFVYESQDAAERLEFSVSADGGVTRRDGYFICPLGSPVIVSTTVSDAAGAEALVEKVFDGLDSRERRHFGEHYETFRAMRNVLAWDTIFDPGEHIVLTTVSRNWNLQWATWPEYGGYVIFDWDTYFAALMLSTGSRELAYANAVEMTLSVDECGFVPNYRSDHDTYTRDRSQPPVGSLCVWKIYERWHDKWFLELLYPRLLTWNRWWPEARCTDGLLCWGSNPYENVSCRQFETRQGSRLAAGLESGLDNSPMYDDAGYDSLRCQMDLQDVGLTSLYAADCEYLAKIATELGYRADASELRRRGARFRKAIQRFWCEEDGMFYNRRVADGSFNKRCSPTNFYVLLAGAAKKDQAERLVREHLCNPDEFWGEWVIPSTPRNDPAWADNCYWRGRIWGPMNFLVYESLCRVSGVEAADKARYGLAVKSERLLLKSWLESGYVFENWSSVDGRGDDVGNSDRYYHWGALTGYIALREYGLIGNE